jgi:hypothetical protein
MKSGTIFENLRNKDRSMKNFIVLISVLICNTILAQDTMRTSSVIVHKDPRIDLLVKKQASINTATKKAYGHTMRGYRLMVMNTNKRDEALAAKTKVYTFFPELKAYLIYQAPFFRLKAGNFKTRDEAQKYQKQMTTLFSKDVFIINDIIEVKPEKADEEEQ